MSSYTDKQQEKPKAEIFFNNAAVYYINWHEIKRGKIEPKDNK